MTRTRFFGIGIFLFAIKFALDRTIATIAFGRGWSVWNYLIPNESYAILALPRADQWFYLTMLGLALPFVVIGVLVTRRRLIDAGLPRWMTVLFFLPAVNLLFFGVLSFLPTARRADSPPGFPRSGRSSAGNAPAQVPSYMEPVPLEYAIPRHRATIEALIPDDSIGNALVAIFAPAGLSIAATFLSATVFRNYGWGLFVGMPFMLGLASSVIYGYRRPRGLGRCILIALIGGVVAMAGLILFAMEGLGCLIMLLPLALPVVVLGAMVGYGIQCSGRRDANSNSLWAATLGLPLLISVEGAAPRQSQVMAVTTSVQVNAPPARVWGNVVSFSDINVPPDWIFRAGVAYPLRARIDGRGVGAVRYCEFSTGAFVEPITVWDEPKLLKFDVTSNPPPMREWSPFNIHPPHLNNFLVSHGGQFHLIELPDGRTRLEGTTWYEHHMWPAPYWQLWSDLLIHRIHRRVLEHVKSLSERDETIATATSR